MRKQSVYREFPQQLVLEHIVTSDLEVQCRGPISAWNKKHQALLVAHMTLDVEVERHKLQYGFLPDLSDEAITDLRAALEPLLGDVKLKPVTYDPKNLISIPLYDLGKPPER